MKHFEFSCQAANLIEYLTPWHGEKAPATHEDAQEDAQPAAAPHGHSTVGRRGPHGS